MSKQKEVYLIEPDSDVSDSICALADSYGVQISAFPNAHSFLETVDIKQLNGHACLLVENNLPDMSGMELYQQLKQQNIHTTFVLLSSSNDAGMEAAALAEDILLVLQKPVQSDYLMAFLKGFHAS